MDYRIDPAPIGGRSSRSVVAIAALVSVALIAGIVALTVTGRPDAQVAVATASVAPLTFVATPRPSLAPSAPLSVSAVAPHIHCHAVTDDRCARIAAAALRAITDPALAPATTVDVWASLLCNDTFDCPPARSLEREPAGSAVIGLASSMVLWVNVVQRDADYDRGSPDPELDAWIIPSRPTS